MSHADQLRADALRWILAIADNHHLPVPGRIETFKMSTGWVLTLHLDDDHGDDVRRWADTLALPMQDDLPVISDRRRFTCVGASGRAPAIVFTGWDTVRISSYCEYTAVSDTAMAVAA